MGEFLIFIFLFVKMGDDSLFEFQDSDIIITKKRRNKEVTFIENQGTDLSLDLSGSKWEKLVEGKDGFIDRNLLTIVALKMSESAKTDPSELNSIFDELKNQVRLAHNYRKRTNKRFKEYQQIIADLKTKIENLEQEKAKKISRYNSIIDENEIENSPSKSDIIGSIEDYQMAEKILDQEINRISNEVQYLEGFFET